MRKIHHINENYETLDSKPDMKEAFDAAIAAKFVTENMIDVKKSHKVNLRDWSAGLIYKRGGSDSVIIYSFTDHKILVAGDDNDGVVWKHDWYGKDGPEALLIQRWNGSHLRYRVVTKEGFILGTTWFEQIERLKTQEPYYIGIDTFHACIIFDIDGNVIRKDTFSDYLMFKGGFYIKHDIDGILYDNDMNVVLDHISSMKWVKYMVTDVSTRTRKEHTILKFESNNKIFYFTEYLYPIVSDIDVENLYKVRDFNGIDSNVCVVSKRRKANIICGNGELVVGDPGDEDTWFDGYDVKNLKTHLIIGRKGESYTPINTLTIHQVCDKWFDEIASLDDIGFHIGYRQLAAVKDKDGCNVLDIDTRDKTYGKMILDHPVDDIKVSKKFMFVEVDGEQYVIWKNGVLIRADHDKMYQVGPITYVVCDEDDRGDIIRTDHDMTFCDTYNDGHKLDDIEITEDDVLGIIGYNGKFSYINLSMFSPAICEDDGSIRWFDACDPAVFDPRLRKARCEVVENGKPTVYYVGT